MNVPIKRLAVAGILLIAGSTLTGCGAGGALQDAAEEVTTTVDLVKAVPTATSPAFRYTIKGGVQPLSGVVDAPRKAMTADISERVPDAGITLTMKFLVIGDKAWTKISFGDAPAGSGLPRLPKKWMRLDPTKLSAESAEDLSYHGETDPGYVNALLLAAADLTETGSGKYVGTTDLTESTEAEIVEAGTLTALGEQAKAVPLEILLDAEGRIAKALVKIPAAGKVKAATYEVRYDQYGGAAPIKAPTDGVAAPAAVYEILNG